MSDSRPWPAVLDAPQAGQHVAQLWTDPAILARAVGDFVGHGVRAGDAAILITTPGHWRGIARRLEEQRFDIEELQRRGQIAVLDAAGCLERLLVNGMPDGGRFHTVIGRPVDAAERAGYRRIRAFGEMVDLLRRTDVAATIWLEALWNELLATHRIALLCGYSVDAFDPLLYGGLLQDVCAMHSDLIPVEDYARFEQAVERAYAEVFGPVGDGEALRRLFLSDYARPSAMPDAAAAILAAREYAPSTVSELLKVARRHYRAPVTDGPGCRPAEKNR